VPLFPKNDMPTTACKYTKNDTS